MEEARAPDAEAGFRHPFLPRVLPQRGHEFDKAALR